MIVDGADDEGDLLADLRLFAATGDRAPGCICRRLVDPSRVILAARCDHHGAHTAIYRQMAEPCSDGIATRAMGKIEGELVAGLANWHTSGVGSRQTRRNRT